MTFEEIDPRVIDTMRKLRREAEDAEYEASTVGADAWRDRVAQRHRFGRALDLPPVNRYADAAILAPKVDGVILVVEADRTPVVDAESAKKSLDRVGARIFGVVLNRRRSYVPATLQALL